MYIPFLRFIKNGLDLNMETTRVTDLDDYSKTWLMDLLRANMKDMYEKSEWGWNEKNKAEEMFDDNAWYVLYFPIIVGLKLCPKDKTLVLTYSLKTILH